jgi:hypothetical protein
MPFTQLKRVTNEDAAPRGGASPMIYPALLLPEFRYPKHRQNRLVPNNNSEQEGSAP